MTAAASERQRRRRPIPPRVALRIVVALGGNAITSADGDGSVERDYENLEKSLSAVIHLLEMGYQVTLTHGNGPQVGNQMVRVEAALDQAPDLPLDLIVADLQGGLGYMAERVLRNKLAARGLTTPVATLITLVEVAADDPAMAEPTKFIGKSMSEDEARRREQERGWAVKEDKGRGWRRVVPSPEPQSILERDAILTLMEAGALVIDTGGGGVPVARDEKGELVGVEAVVDKDLASAVLAREIGATQLFILTEVEQVSLHFGTPEEEALGEITVTEARRYLDEGHFPAGSMGPKVQAACQFVEEGGHRALITNLFKLEDALDRRTGTWVVADQARTEPVRTGRAGDRHPPLS